MNIGSGTRTRWPNGITIAQFAEFVSEAVQLFDNQSSTGGIDYALIPVCNAGLNYEARNRYESASYTVAL